MSNEMTTANAQQSQGEQIKNWSSPVAAQVDAVHVDIRIPPTLQGAVSPVLAVLVNLVQSLVAV